MVVMGLSKQAEGRPKAGGAFLIEPPGQDRRGFLFILRNGLLLGNFGKRIALRIYSASTKGAYIMRYNTDNTSSDFLNKQSPL
jgi:hypothetical protein